MGKPVAWTLLIASLAAVSCGGGGGGVSGPGHTLGVSPGGIWRGSDSASGLAVTGLIDESGAADFIRADNAQFTGQISTTDSGLTGEGEAFAEAAFPDGSVHGLWSMSGTIQERQAIAAQITFITDNGTETTGTLDLGFDPLYNLPPSLASVSGSYSSGGVELVVAADGGLGFFAELICQSSGQIAVIHPDYNLYHVHVSTTCDNGTRTDATGMATLDDTATPEQLLMGLTSPNSSGVNVWQRL